jgi:ABC-type transport system involved in multi-copper enzyme maturation permease subunit
VRWGGGALVGLMALMVGLHAAGSVARERQQETLVDLLAIPRRRREILWAKWVGSLAKVRGIAVGTAAVPLVAYIADGLSIWAAFLLVLAAGAILAYAASFGLWLSVRTRTVQRASGLWMLLVGIWVGGTFLAAQAVYVQQQDRYSTFRYPPKPREPLVWDRIVNPALAWSQLTFRFSPEGLERTYYSPKDDADGVISDLSEVIPSLAGIMVMGLFAWLLYLWAGKRFEREGLS